MKNFFGICISRDGEPTGRDYDGERFAIRAVSPELRARIDEAQSNAQGVEQKVSLPFALSILKTVFFGAFLIVLFGVLKNVGEASFSEMLGNAPWLFIIAGLSLALWLVLSLVERKKVKAVIDSGEIQKLNVDFNALDAEASGQLEVPEDAVRADVFGCFYSSDSGKEKLRKMGSASYLNCEMRLFTEDGRLCITDMIKVYAIPLDDFKCYVRKKKKAVFSGWNKDESCIGKYRGVRVTEESDGNLRCRFAALRFSDCFGEYELCFPEYELETFRQLVDLPVFDE